MREVEGSVSRRRLPGRPLGCRLLALDGGVAESALSGASPPLLLPLLLLPNGNIEASTKYTIPCGTRAESTLNVPLVAVRVKRRLPPRASPASISDTARPSRGHALFSMHCSVFTGNRLREIWSG